LESGVSRMTPETNRFELPYLRLARRRRFVRLRRAFDVRDRGDRTWSWLDAHRSILRVRLSGGEEPRSGATALGSGKNKAADRQTAPRSSATSPRSRKTRPRRRKTVLRNAKPIGGAAKQCAAPVSMLFAGGETESFRQRYRFSGAKDERSGLRSILAPVREAVPDRVSYFWGKVE